MKIRQQRARRSIADGGGRRAAAGLTAAVTWSSERSRGGLSSPPRVADYVELASQRDHPLMPALPYRYCHGRQPETTAVSRNQWSQTRGLTCPDYRGALAGSRQTLIALENSTCAPVARCLRRSAGSDERSSPNAASAPTIRPERSALSWADELALECDDE
jgi:hypothetical protein